MITSNTDEKLNPNLEKKTFWDKVDNIIDNSVQAGLSSYGFNYFFGNSKNALTNYTNYSKALNVSSILETGAVVSLGKCALRRMIKEDYSDEILSYRNTLNDLFHNSVSSAVWAASYTGIQHSHLLNGSDIASIAVKTGAIVMLSASLNTVLNPLYEKNIKPLTDKLGEKLDKATQNLKPENVVNFISVQAAKISTKLAR